MPLTLTVTHTPRRLVTFAPAPAVPDWRLLHAHAGQLEGQLQLLWDSVFRDLQDGLDVDELATALEHGALPTEHLLWSAWHRVTQAATRAPLLALLHSAASRIADALTPGMAQLLEAPGLRFDVPTPDMTQYIDQYVGSQLVDVTQTTMQSVKEVVRQAVASGRTVQQEARDLRAVVGLTPRQTRAVEALRQRLTDQGLSDAHIQRQVDLAAARGVKLRAQQVARTESMAVANEAQLDLNRQAQDAGWLPADQKKQWLITDDKRLCPQCEAIPGMNEGGVPLNEPFTTPFGDLMRPPGHPACRCVLTLVM